MGDSTLINWGKRTAPWACKACWAITALCAALWLSNWIWESHFVLGSQVFIQKHGALRHGWFTVPAQGDTAGTTAAQHTLLWGRVDPRLNLTSNGP